MQTNVLYPDEYNQLLDDIKSMGSGILKTVVGRFEKGEMLTVQEVVKTTVYSRREDYSYEHMGYTGREMVVRVMFVREDRPGWQDVYVTLPNL